MRDIKWLTWPRDHKASDKESVVVLKFSKEDRVGWTDTNRVI